MKLMLNVAKESIVYCRKPLLL